MQNFFQQILSILTVAPGNLIYHLVLAFSIAGALQGSLQNWRASGYPQGRRMVAGLILLLILRLALFLTAGLGWQGVVAEHTLLPPLDLGVALLSLVIIIWLWAYPEPLRLADAATGLLAMLALTLTGFAQAWWLQQATVEPFNSSWLSINGELLALLLAAGGALILLARRPNGWGYGLALLGMLAMGHAAEFGWTDLQGDYPGGLRLAQMAAYPLLFALPTRFPIPTSSPASVQSPAVAERGRFGADARLLQTYISLVTETSPDKLCHGIARIAAQALLADASLVVFPPNEDGQIIAQCGYDLIREEKLGGAAFSTTQLPVVAAALRRGRSLRLPDSTTSPDLVGLARPFNFNRAGHLLVAPLLDDKGTTMAALVLLSPYSNRSWTIEDQHYLVELCESFARLMQRERSSEALLQTDLERARQELNASQTESDALRQENNKLLAQVESIQKSLTTMEGQIVGRQSQADSLAALIAAQEEAQISLAQLKEENEQLMKANRQPLAVQLTEESPENGPDIPGEMRLALEEVADLRRALAASEARLAEMQQDTQQANVPSQHLAQITSQIQEIRQPLASALGYTEFLLSEQIGILGSNQRKLLERVHLSVARMSALVEDLVRLTNQETQAARVSGKTIDLQAVLENAIQQTAELRKTRNVELRKLLPERLPEVNGELADMADILEKLLVNAGEVTPAQGEVLVQANEHRNEDDTRYVLIRVADQGGGIGHEDLPRLFASAPQTESTMIHGVSLAPSELTGIKSRVEALSGRIWVDNLPGIGATYSVLLPAAPTTSRNGRGSQAA